MTNAMPVMKEVLDIELCIQYIFILKHSVGS